MIGFALIFVFVSGRRLDYGGLRSLEQRF